MKRTSSIIVAALLAVPFVAIVVYPALIYPLILMVGYTKGGRFGDLILILTAGVFVAAALAAGFRAHLRNFGSGLDLTRIDARVLLAFLAAPLSVSVVLVLVVVLLRGGDLYQPWLGYPVILGTLLAYGPGLLLAIPIYRFLMRRRWTAFWIAPVVGFAVGAMVWLVGTSLIFDLRTAFTAMKYGAPLVGGLLGALFAAVLWLIARPDRQVVSSACD
jgi:hypothetical protein